MAGLSSLFVLRMSLSRLRCLKHVLNFPDVAAHMTQSVVVLQTKCICNVDILASFVTVIIPINRFLIRASAQETSALQQFAWIDKGPGHGPRHAHCYLLSENSVHQTAPSTTARWWLSRGTLYDLAYPCIVNTLNGFDEFQWKYSLLPIEPCILKCFTLWVK